MKNLRVLFGERVRSLRKAQGLSQERLGRKSVLHPTYIGCIERAEVSVSIDSIEKLAQGLDVEVKELFQFPARNKASTEKEELLMSLMSLAKEQDEETLGKILTVVKEIWG